MQSDIVIIGGNPAGGTVASTARTMYPGKSILVIRKEKESLVPCGIPYTFGTLPKVEDDIKSIEPAQKKGIDFLFDEVLDINSESKELKLKNGSAVFYEKLVIATGSIPFIPPIPGRELENVFTIGKELEYIRKIKPLLLKKNRITIVGAGFIGMEMADELTRAGKEVVLVEAMNALLPLAFDEDMASSARVELEKENVTILTSTRVEEIEGRNGAVSGIRLDSGEVLETDGVILAIGYQPNTALAEKSGIRTGQFKGIITDEYMQTNLNDIFAVGDCVEHKDFFTRKASRLMLASTAASESRIAGMNLYELQVIRRCKGNVAIMATKIGDTVLASAGMTQSQAEREGFPIIIGRAGTLDKHPGTMPGAKKQNMKLIFSRRTGMLLGAQLAGGSSSGEMINTLGLAIQKQMTASELAMLQYGTQPMLTAGPGFYPIPMAALDALEKQFGS